MCARGAVRRVTAGLAAVTLVAGCGAGSTIGRPQTSASPTGPAASSPAPVPTLVVAGHRIAVTGVGDVEDALVVAGVTVPAGRLLAVVSHRVLDRNDSPGHVLVDGRAAQLTAAVHAGDVVTVVAGRDRIESTERVTVLAGLGPTATALYTRVVTGTAAVVRGSVSGERVSVTVIRAPTVGTLRLRARVAFTFDDGPSVTFTPMVLGLLVAARVPTVFCLVGANAVAHPSLVRDEANAGERLCDHTQTHPLNLPSLSNARIAAEITTGYTSIATAGGSLAPTYFRAPGGHWSTTIEADARALHLIPLRWTVDPSDWSKPGTATIVARTLDQLRPNGIVLLHDGNGDRSETVAALRILLPELAAAGWTFSFPTWVR